MRFKVSVTSWSLTKCIVISWRRSGGERRSGMPWHGWYGRYGSCAQFTIPALSDRLSTHTLPQIDGKNFIALANGIKTKRNEKRKEKWKWNKISISIADPKNISWLINFLVCTGWTGFTCHTSPQSVLVYFIFSIIIWMILTLNCDNTRDTSEWTRSERNNKENRRSERRLDIL